MVLIIFTNNQLSYTTKKCPRISVLSSHLLSLVLCKYYVLSWMLLERWLGENYLVCMHESLTFFSWNTKQFGNEANFHLGHKEADICKLMKSYQGDILLLEMLNMYKISNHHYCSDFEHLLSRHEPDFRELPFLSLDQSRFLSAMSLPLVLLRI